MGGDQAEATKDLIGHLLSFKDSLLLEYDLLLGYAVSCFIYASSFI